MLVLIHTEIINLKCFFGNLLNKICANINRRKTAKTVSSDCRNWICKPAKTGVNYPPG